MAAIMLLLACVLAGCGGDSQSDDSSQPSQPEPTFEMDDLSAQDDAEPDPQWPSLVKELPTNSKRVSHGESFLQVIGSCKSNGGTGLALNGGGFAPDAEYDLYMEDSNGEPYDDYLADDFGWFDKHGQPSHWRLNCYDTISGDPIPSGTYVMYIDVLDDDDVVSQEFKLKFTIDS